jgi:hypothetical protein
MIIFFAVIMLISIMTAKKKEYILIFNEICKLSVMKMETWHTLSLCMKTFKCRIPKLAERCART